MSFLTDWITEWLKGLLIDGIMGNLSGLFDNVNRKVEKSGVVRRFYRCSRYANSGSKSCSMHTIDADTLESIILSDIQYYAQTAISDEKKLYDRLLSFSGQECKNEKAAQEKALRDATNRIS